MMAKNYRLVESYPKDGKRHGEPVRNIAWTGPDKAGLKKAIADWCAVQHDFSESNTKRKPYAEYFTYHGSKRIYPYEI
jgi:hypothetical protein